METSVKITAIIVGAVLVLGLIYWGVNAPKNELSVEGMSTIKAMPDLVSVYFSVETSGATAQDAKDNNSEIVDKVIENIIKTGLERKEIVTENFNVYEDFVWQNNKQQSRGFKAVHSLMVQLSANNTDRAGDVIDAGVDGGARISYINFELSQEKENYYKSLAYKNAAEDARIKAESIASGLGKSIDEDPISVSVQEFDYMPWRVFGEEGVVASASEAKAVATSIQPGEKDITGRVSVVFRIV